MRIKKGIVTSVAMDKTIIVSENVYKMDSKYKKWYKVTKKFYVHDEKNSCSIWDNVVIKETKPYSKLKRWDLVEKVS